jgi:DnaJ-class molecular chaperone
MTQVCDVCDGFGFTISYIVAQMAQRYNTTETTEPCEDCNGKGRIEYEV